MWRHRVASRGLGVQGRDAAMWDPATSGRTLVFLPRCSIGDLGGGKGLEMSPRWVPVPEHP